MSQKIKKQPKGEKNYSFPENINVIAVARLSTKERQAMNPDTRMEHSIDEQYKKIQEFVKNSSEINRREYIYQIILRCSSNGNLCCFAFSSNFPSSSISPLLLRINIFFISNISYLLNYSAKFDQKLSLISFSLTAILFSLRASINSLVFSSEGSFN